MKIDTHVHTSEVSPCGKVPAQEMMRMYKDAGYDLVIVTDHLFPTLKTLAAGKNAAEKAEIWLSGYRVAREEGEKIGLKVLLGAELRLEKYGNEDFLAFGLQEEDVPWIFAMLEEANSVAEMSARVRGRGLFLVQAHPYRPGLRAQNPALLDGVEAYNGNPRHNSSNHLALQHGLSGALRLLSGSDAHQPQDVGRGGLNVPETICDNASWLEWLRNGAARTQADFEQIAIRTEE